MTRRFRLPALACLLLAASGFARAGASLQAPSPDWRDQVIYFVMTDRFDDADRGNDDQHAGEFDPKDNAKYNGGDLRGIERRLDYIRGLGATAVWITPPVSNLWWDPVAHYGGYHGYWAENFMTVDAHLGSLRDYRRLSKKIHGAGMVLVQDIVLNHTGSYFNYDGGWDPNDPAVHFKLNADSRGRTAPSQWPFSMNDARIPEQRAAAVYHWTPNVSDYKDPVQLSTYQMAGLDDLNSENPLVRSALRKSYGFWIREAGVDAFRIDTAFYVPPEAIDDFLYSQDKRDPGILQVAQATGRKSFHVFGEGFAVDRAYDDTQAKRIEALMHRPDGKALMPGMLNFPLYATIGDVFARGRPTAEMSYRIRSMMRVHATPELMPTFLDNHDVDRFLAGGSPAGLKQGLLLLMTLPGIPTIYYGTEQGFSVSRAAMFKEGSGSGGVDHFDTSAPLYRFIQRATALRREHRLFSRGKPTILRDNAATPGVLAYRMSEGADSAIVVLNTSDGEALLDNLDTGAAAGSVMAGIFDIDEHPSDVLAGEGGLITMTLPPHSGKVWLLTNKREPLAPTSASIGLDALVSESVSGDFLVSGQASGIAQFKLVIDGDIATAPTVPVGRDGRWSATVDTSRMIDPKVEHVVVAFADTPSAVSARRGFRVDRQWLDLVDIADPAGDDNGPAHCYRYPDDASWGSHHQADIQRVRIAGSGGALRISLRMNQISTPWNPPNGFDHVAFTIFLQVPGKAGGVSTMPFQNASLPQGMQWNYRLRAHGWSNALFSSEGASSNGDGMATAPAAGIEVDAANNTITFTLSGTALGGIRSLSGVRIYVSTWDYDGGFRPLTAEPSGAAFGGGSGSVDPLVMDDTSVIVIP
jgi:glycosidase